VGILRKLAGLVVEFPDETAPTASGTGGGSEGADDVLASIEKARLELEGHVAQRRTGSSPAGRPDPLGGADSIANPFAAEANLPPPAPSEAASGSKIPLPTLLTVEQVYERAGLSSDPQQMNIYRVQQMVGDPEMADLDMTIRARMVKMTLKSMGHDLHEIIVDAAKRDSALDSYGGWLTAQVENVGAQVEAENAKLKQEIEEFIAAKNAQIQANRAALEQARQSQASFSQTRQAEEQRLFDTVAPFVAPGENPVVVGGSAPKRKGDPQ
jgi:hypothetical protein